MTAALLLTRFLSELAALAGFAIWGTDALGLPGVVVPLAAAAVWGVWMAPRSGRRLPDPGRLVAEIVFFGLAAAAYAAAGAPVAAVVFGVIAIGCAVLVRYGRAPGPTPAA